MNNESKQGKLPAGLLRAASELRRMEPSEGFDDRLREALRRADQTSLEDEVLGGGTQPPVWSGLLEWALLVRAAGLAAAGATILAALFWIHTADDDDVLHRMEELEFVLEDDGHSWLPLTLDTDHHDGEHADVYVEAPKELMVRASRFAQRGEEPSCGPQKCVHRFAHPTNDGAQPQLAIGVSEPGEYRITVEHASPRQRVREVFLVAVR